MATLQELVKCELCGKRGEELSLYSAQHKNLGWIKICRECWVKLYDSNSIVAGSSGCGKGSCPTCGL